MARKHYSTLFTEPVWVGKIADIQEIINYRNAMTVAIEEMESRPLCLNLIRDLHRVLLESVRGRDRAPGEFRRVQNYIAPLGAPIEESSFVPPSPEMVLPALSNWEKYLHFEEKDPLVQLAVAKAQFELIHPFLDGNGRIGRILIPIFLFDKRVLSSPMFYLSAYLERNRPLYYERLNAISRKGDWNGWIAFFLAAIIEQAEANSTKARAILGLYERMKQIVPEITRSQYAIQAIDAVFRHPVFQSTDFIAFSSIPRDSALRVLNSMKESKIVTVIRESKGRRPALMAFMELIGITEGKV